MTVLVTDVRATLTRLVSGWRLTQRGVETEFAGDVILRVGRKAVRIRAMPGYEQNPDRWRYQIRRAEQQKARLERKLRLVSGSLAEVAYQKRLAAIEDDLVNWRAALWAAGEPTERDQS